MSREEKEKLLSEKMENIRRKNEELRKRHEEIEADKKNADKISSTVTMDKVKPYVMKAPRARPEKSERPREPQEHPSIPRPSDIMPTRQRLSENDGPPPDPSYRFLSDPDRDGCEKERKRDGRGKRKGKLGSKWGSGEGQEEEGEKIDKEDNEVPDFNSPGGQGNRGRGKSEKSPGDQKFGRGRGSRGRGYGRMPHEQEYEQEEEFHKSDNFENQGGGGDWNKPKSSLSFACRDIRYYPDENEDYRGGKDVRGRGRGRQNYGQWDHNNDNRRSHRRGGGRGRINDQQREYERWKAERAAIDEARLTRGKTDGGNWRREWDNDKINQGESEEVGPVYDPRFPRSKSENYKLADLINFPNNDGPAQPSLPQRKVQRERRKGNSQESREKFVKVDTLGLVQKQLKLGGSDPKEANWRSPPGPSQECDEKSSSEDVIVISDDMNDTSDENPAEYEEFSHRPKSVEIMDSANEEGPIDKSYNNDHLETSEEVPGEHEASSERPKSVEGMNSANECSYEGDLIVTSFDNVHSEMNDKIDEQTSGEVPAEHEVSTERPKSVEIMDSANDCQYEEGQIDTSCDNDHSDMNDKIDDQPSEEIPAQQEASTERQKSVESMDSAIEGPCEEGPIDISCNNDISEMNVKTEEQVFSNDDPITSAQIKVNEELVVAQQTETSKEPIIETNIVCDEPASNE